jgi:hypothetical protein
MVSSYALLVRSDGGSGQRSGTPDATCFRLNGWAMPEEAGQVGDASTDR